MSSHTHFPRAVDRSDPAFNSEDPQQFVESRAQRVRETKIAIEEMRVLQEKLFRCYYRHAPDHYTQCKDLATAYKERLDWGNTHLPPVDYPNSECRLRRLPDGGFTMINQ